MKLNPFLRFLAASRFSDWLTLALFVAVVMAMPGGF